MGEGREGVGVCEIWGGGRKEGGEERVGRSQKKGRLCVLKRGTLGGRGGGLCREPPGVAAFTKNERG